MKDFLKTLVKTLAPYVLVVAAVIAIAKSGIIIRWLFTTNPVSPAQQHTIDSLRTVNETLDSTLTTVLRQQEELRRTQRRVVKADSIATQHALDSLRATIPDTATIVPRQTHEAIVGRLEGRILTLERAVFVADSLLERRTFDLTELRRQNSALLTQVNDLERKANPGLIRQLKIALPYVGGLYGACKIGVIKCD